jgi:hypothetical protein
MYIYNVGDDARGLYRLSSFKIASRNTNFGSNKVTKNGKALNMNFWWSIIYANMTFVLLWRLLRTASGSKHSSSNRTRCNSRTPTESQQS